MPLILLALLVQVSGGTPAVAAGEATPHATATSVKDLPLVEVRPAAPRPGPLVVMVSGDGGWAELDRDVAARLARAGLPVVGLDALRYFWKRRDPQEAAAALDHILRHYLAAWDRREVAVIGYSRGAEVVPFMVDRLAPDLLAKVRLVALLGPSRMAGFQFHFADWFTDENRASSLPVLPEARRLADRPLLCFYGDEEKDSLCPLLAETPARLIRLHGAHHFGGHYGEIADEILKEIRG